MAADMTYTNEELAVEIYGTGLERLLVDTLAGADLLAQIQQTAAEMAIIKANGLNQIQNAFKNPTHDF